MSKVYKIGILADCHLDAKPYGLEEKRQDIFKSFVLAVKILKKKDIDLLIVAGDLFDNEKPSFEAYYYANYLTVFDNVFFIEGNHDRGVSNFFESIGIKKREYFAINDKLVIAGIDYIDNHNELRKKIYQIQNDLEAKNTILVLHCNINTVMPYLKESSKVIFKSDLNEFKLSIIGHFHNSYYDGKILVPGSLERLNVLNTEERKVFILEIDEKNNINVEPILIPTRKIIEVKDKKELNKVLKEESLKPIVFYTGNPSELSMSDILLAEKKCLLFDIKHKFKKAVDGLLNQEIEINLEKVKEFLWNVLNENNINKDLIKVFMENYGNIKKAQENLKKLIEKEYEIKGIEY